MGQVLCCLSLVSDTKPHHFAEFVLRQSVLTVPFRQPHFFVFSEPGFEAADEVLLTTRSVLVLFAHPVDFGAVFLEPLAFANFYHLLNYIIQVFESLTS